MKPVLVAMLCIAVSACSSTAEAPAPASTTTASTTIGAASVKPAARAGETKTAAARGKDACEQAMQAQTNAAMLGGALGMVGSFGGLGGRGGMVASQVAATAGNVVANSQSARARAGVMQECY